MTSSGIETATLACSAVLQPTSPPRNPLHNYLSRNCEIHSARILWKGLKTIPFRVTRSAYVCACGCVCVCGSRERLCVSTVALNVNLRIFYLKFQQTLPQTARNVETLKNVSICKFNKLCSRLIVM